MISPEKEWDWVTSQIKTHIDRATDAFKLFIQLFSAIVGGSIWLSQGTLKPAVIPRYVTLSNILVIILTIIAIVMIFENMRSWYGYRKVQAELARDVAGNYTVPLPKLFPACAIQTVMCFGMIFVAYLFWLFNPFLSP